MSYKLQQPYSMEERADFLIEHEQNNRRTIIEIDDTLIALEAWELLVNGEVLDNTEQYELELAQKERERIDGLYVTRGDMFEALLRARQLPKAQIREMIIQYVTDPMQQALMLNRFDEALNYYRGYPIFNLLGEYIGITSEQWDSYFIKGNNEATKADAWKELLLAESDSLEAVVSAVDNTADDIITT